MSIEKLNITGMHLQKANIFGRDIPSKLENKKNSRRVVPYRPVVSTAVTTSGPNCRIDQARITQPRVACVKRTAIDNPHITTPAVPARQLGCGQNEMTSFLSRQCNQSL